MNKSYHSRVKYSFLTTVIIILTIPTVRILYSESRDIYRIIENKFRVFNQIIQYVNNIAFVVDIHVLYIHNNLKCHDNLKIDIIYDNSLVIPEYKIDFKNKGKKIIEKIESLTTLTNQKNLKKESNVYSLDKKVKKSRFYKKKFYKKKIK